MGVSQSNFSDSKFTGALPSREEYERLPDLERQALVNEVLDALPSYVRENFANGRMSFDYDAFVLAAKKSVLYQPSVTTDRGAYGRFAESGQAYVKTLPTKASVTPTLPAPVSDDVDPPTIDIEMADLQSFNLPDTIFYHLDAGGIGEADHPQRDGWGDFLMPAWAHTLGYGHLRIENFALNPALTNAERLTAIRGEIYHKRMNLHYHYSECRRYLPELEKVVAFIAQKMGVAYEALPPSQVPQYNLAISVSQLVNKDQAALVWGVDSKDKGIFQVHLSRQAIDELLAANGMTRENITSDSQEVIYLKIARDQLGPVQGIPTITNENAPPQKPLLSMASKNGGVQLTDYQQHLSDSSELPVFVKYLPQAQEALFVLGMLISPMASRGGASNALIAGMNRSAPPIPYEVIGRTAEGAEILQSAIPANARSSFSHPIPNVSRPVSGVPLTELAVVEAEGAALAAAGRSSSVRPVAISSRTPVVLMPQVGPVSSRPVDPALPTTEGQTVVETQGFKSELEYLGYRQLSRSVASHRDKATALIRNKTTGEYATYSGDLAENLSSPVLTQKNTLSEVKDVLWQGKPIAKIDETHLYWDVISVENSPVGDVVNRFHTVMQKKPRVTDDRYTVVFEGRLSETVDLGNEISIQSEKVTWKIMDKASGQEVTRVTTTSQREPKLRLKNQSLESIPVVVGEEELSGAHQQPLRSTAKLPEDYEIAGGYKPGLKVPDREMWFDMLDQAHRLGRTDFLFVYENTNTGTPETIRLHLECKAPVTSSQLANDNFVMSFDRPGSVMELPPQELLQSYQESLDFFITRRHQEDALGLKPRHSSEYLADPTEVERHNLGLEVDHLTRNAAPREDPRRMSDTEYMARSRRIDHEHYYDIPGDIRSVDTVPKGFGTGNVVGTNVNGEIQLDWNGFQKDVYELLERFGIPMENVFVQGSRILGKSRVDSDVDIAVVVSPQYYQELAGRAPENYEQIGLDEFGEFIPGREKMIMKTEHVPLSVGGQAFAEAVKALAYKYSNLRDAPDDHFIGISLVPQNSRFNGQTVRYLDDPVTLAASERLAE